MNFFKKIRKLTTTRRLASFFITLYVKLIWATGKWQYLGKEHPNPYWEKNKAVIGCFWHGRLLMMLKVWLGTHKFHMLISSHPDGEIIARATQNFGFGWIKFCHILSKCYFPWVVDIICAYKIGAR